jgi:eukaryotic-like serine/threonine-protein kinase
VTQDPRVGALTDWSRDSRYLIGQVRDPKTGTDIWVLPTLGGKPYPYLNAEFNETMGALSPNGQFLAYRSDESKRPEIYAQTFPEHGGKWQISTGGTQGYPTWSRDGRELYYISADDQMMAVEVKGEGMKFAAGVPKALFPVPNSKPEFNVSKDGRFLIHVLQNQAAASVPLTVVVNWQSALKK